MSNKHYYTFYFVDGTKQEFEQHDNILTKKIKDYKNKRILVDNSIINMDNVIKVELESKDDREKHYDNLAGKFKGIY